MTAVIPTAGAAKRDERAAPLEGVGLGGGCVEVTAAVLELVTTLEGAEGLLGVERVKAGVDVWERVRLVPELLELLVDTAVVEAVVEAPIENVPVLAKTVLISPMSTASRV
jgi:hypothetical protein